MGSARAMTDRDYLPAAGRAWALPLYDVVTRLLGFDRARQAILDHADLRTEARVLDIGCGTGSLAVSIKRLHGKVEVVGLDPDPKALARGRRKAEAAGAVVRFDQGFSDQLPYPDASFDRVFSSLMLHHLTPEEKDRTLSEVRRVLKPGGVLHLVDFGGPDPGPRGFLAHVLHAGPHLSDNFEGRILARMRQAGFTDPSEVAHRASPVGRVAYYRASVAVLTVGRTK